MEVIHDEPWILQQKDIQQTESIKMKFLRPVKGSIKINTITDGQIRMNLHIFAVIEKRLEFRTSLKGAFRMIAVMRIPKAALLYKSAGKRHIGFRQGNA